MISAAEEEYIRNQAYLPEQVVAYGTVVSGGEPFLLKDYLCYVPPEALVFIGYPLSGDFEEEEMNRALEQAIRRFKPSQIALIAPRISRRSGKRAPPDTYYRLKLNDLRLPPKVKNMVQRAARELKVEKTRMFRCEHHELVNRFLKSRSVDEATGHILAKIPDYVAASPTAWIFDARNPAGDLIGFDVAEFMASQSAFYMFNFRSHDQAIPGTSDLLLQALVQESVKEGKTFLNLGLGINPGVTFFKKKWGGQAFLNYEFLTFRPEQATFWDSILKGFPKP